MTMTGRTSTSVKVSLLLARREDYRTSHVLHLLLSVITVGLWLPIWLLCGISNYNERLKIDKRLRVLENSTTEPSAREG